MLLWNKLQLEAHKVVDRAHARMEAVQVELSKLEERRTSLEAEMAELRRASSRLADFPASLGTNYMCPYCWILDRKAAVMLAVGAEAAEESVRCRECERELRAC